MDDWLAAPFANGALATDDLVARIAAALAGAARDIAASPEPPATASESPAPG